MKPKRVLSLFDGMSCLQIALSELGIVPDVYFASEIEKAPIKSTMTVFPNTIQLGDVRFIKGADLGFIDLLGGGSPCQSFSFAGTRKGMAAIEKFVEPTNQEYLLWLETSPVFLDFEDYIEKCRVKFKKDNTETIEILTLDHYLELKDQNFEFEGQSYLFWEYIRILEELRVVNPNIKFLLENVVMGEKWQKVLTRAIGINPIRINSALVSAQNRDRLYWTNIYAEPNGLFGDLKCMIPQPKDEGILLKDVLEIEVLDKYFLSDKMLRTINKHGAVNTLNNDKSNCLLANYFKMGGRDQQYVEQNNFTQCVAMRGREVCLTPKRTEYGKKIRKDYESGKIKTERKNVQSLEPREDGKTNCLTSVQKDNLIFKYKQDNPNHINGKKDCLRANAGGVLRGVGIIENSNIRRLTPRECGRLQTVPEPILDVMLSAGISDTQIYKMFGNGWTIKSITHILKFL